MTEKKTEEMEEMMAEEAFSVSAPVPKNKRLISIAGTIPGCNTPAYWLFEKFLWTLINLDKESADPITLFINSYGGDMDSLLYFYDFTTMLKSPIYTVTNNAESAGAMMFILGTKGYRYMFPSAHLLIHDCQITASCPDCEESKKQKDKTWKENRLIASYNRRLVSLTDKCTGGKILKLLPDNLIKESNQEERDLAIFTLLEEEIVLTAEEAIKYGAADYIITPKIFDKLQRT
ncbi:MAG: ATP-dependent Clp protease proteolytic subunit [bacterium]|nr:ATP-dependent Clp protease proteolytic subunit [bacterium]